MADQDAQNALRLLILCAGNPEAERTFSGSARSLFQALERRGCVLHKSNVLGMTDPFDKGNLPMRLFRKLDRFNVERNYRYSAFALARNTRRAQAIADNTQGYNACLMYGTTFHPTVNVPMYCYFDATAAQIAQAGGWSYGSRTAAQNQKVIDYQKHVFDDCTAIFPRTEYAASSVHNDYGVPRNNISVAGAGSNHNATPLPHGSYATRNILFIGAEFERKGGPLILDAFKIVRHSMPDATLTIIGANPDIKEPGVDVVGRIYKDAEGGLNRILEYYSRASVFCIMSELEPFGIVIIEAQNSCVPCIVPAKFAFTETVQHGVTGMHVADETPESLSKIMLELLADPEKLETMGKAGHEFVQNEWTWDKAAERIEKRILSDLQKRGEAVS
jgi:glycosyltransferase involved in cell wall biosynthesis